MKLGRWAKKNPWTTAALVAAAVVVVVVLVRTLRRREGWEFVDDGKTTIKDDHGVFVREKCKAGWTWKDIKATEAYAHLSQYDENTLYDNWCKPGMAELDNLLVSEPADASRCKRKCTDPILKHNRPCANKYPTTDSRAKCCKPVEGKKHKLTYCAWINKTATRNQERTDGTWQYADGTKSSGNKVALYSEVLSQGTKQEFVIGTYTDFRGITPLSLYVPPGLKVILTNTDKETGTYGAGSYGTLSEKWKGKLARMTVTRA